MAQEQLLVTVRQVALCLCLSSCLWTLAQSTQCLFSPETLFPYLASTLTSCQRKMLSFVIWSFLWHMVPCFGIEILTRWLFIPINKIRLGMSLLGRKVSYQSKYAAMWIKDHHLVPSFAHNPLRLKKQRGQAPYAGLSVCADTDFLIAGRMQKMGAARSLDCWIGKHHLTMSDLKFIKNIIIQMVCKGGLNWNWIWCINNNGVHVHMAPSRLRYWAWLEYWLFPEKKCRFAVVKYLWRCKNKEIFLLNTNIHPHMTWVALA